MSVATPRGIYLVYFSVERFDTMVAGKPRLEVGPFFWSPIFRRVMTKQD